MNEELITVSLTLPRAMLSSVYAVLAGSAAVAVPLAAPAAPSPSPTPSPTSPASASSLVGAAAASSPVASLPASPSSAPAAPAGVELDAAGVPWSPDKHASTKAKVGSGLWRMKVGVKRLPEESETSPNYRKPGENAPASTPAASPPPPPPPAAATAEDDEFAAFRNAAAAQDAAPAAPAGARTWTDADLSKLCNQAAIASGNPETVKSIIAKYVGDDVPHSRNIPAEQRENFAQEVELAFGIQYAAG